MVYGSHYSSAMEDAAGYGWEGVGTDISFDWKKFMTKKNKEISRLNGIYGKMLGGAGVDVIEGYGKFNESGNPNEVVVEKANGETTTLTADKVLVSVGGWPFKPDIPGAEHTITSNEVFYLEEQPKRVIVVGGGYIAVEFACILSGLGSEVDLMYRGPLFLRGFDEEVREFLATELGKRPKLSLSFNTNPKEIVKNADGTFTVTTEDGASHECDCVMYATGRKPKLDGLNLDKVGVKLGRKGEIVVDDMSQSSVPNIYAVGDVTERMNLTPVALMEGHCFADSVFGGKPRKPDHAYVASAVFSQPEIGSCGFTEEDAVKEFKNVTVWRSSFRPMLHTLTGADVEMLIKVIADTASDRVVGVHIVGDHAGEMIQGLAIAIKAGLTKADFDNTVGVHPSSLEEIVTMRTPSYKYENGSKI